MDAPDRLGFGTRSQPLSTSWPDIAPARLLLRVWRTPPPPKALRAGAAPSVCISQRATQQATAGLTQWKREGGSWPLHPAIELSDRWRLSCNSGPHKHATPQNERHH